IKQGTKRNIWQKVGNQTIEHQFEPPYFRETIDNYSEVKKSNKWKKFRSGSTQRWHIGELDEETRKLPTAGVLPPEAIVKWIETGWHGFLEPM
ncbi:MAG: hypothetical protein IH619_01395, partial [Ignavibacterium sp.]|nr:hypothetical protein [Ignavibacterium sp.]